MVTINQHSSPERHCRPDPNMIKNRKGVLVLGIMVFYIFVNFVWFPKGQRQASTPVASGVNTVTGDTQNELWTTGDDDDVCFHYDGILLISHADEDGFATVFFLFVLNQLIYADKHNLLPWIHLEGPSNKYVYDAAEHNPRETIELDLTVLNGLEWDNFTDSQNGQTYKYPGKPILDYTDKRSEAVNFIVDGSGIWNSYFEPASGLDPLRHLVHHELNKFSTCHRLPIFQLKLNQIEPSLMLYAPWAVRAWRRKSTPPSLANWGQPYQEWFDPMRRTAHEVIRRHFHPHEEMTDLAHMANPVVASEDACLALHIRHSDKADRREQIAVDEFRPYVEAYKQASVWVGTTIAIYVATDSDKVLKQLQREWPSTITSHIRFQTGGIVRSSNTTAVFSMTEDHHRTNKEVFTDILAMAECEFMVHGMSAVTEAVHYLNLRLHNQSVNLEEEMTEGGNFVHRRKATMTSKEFETVVRNRLTTKRRETEAKKKEMDHGLGPKPQTSRPPRSGPGS